MKKKKYLLAEVPDLRYNAGEKARNDVVDIFKKNHFEHVVFFHKGKHKVIVFIEMILAFLKLLFMLRKDDIIAIQYPYTPIKAYKTIYKTFISIVKLKKANIIAVIHDLNYLRNTEGLEDSSNLEYNQFNPILEISILNEMDVIICHNEKMKSRLVQDGLNSDKIVELIVFDYVCDKIEKKLKYSNNQVLISIAGNLDPNKAGYIKELKNINSKLIKFELYGPNYKIEDEIENIIYKGVVKPEELPHKIYSNFGLVWDGNSLSECDGYLGRYLQYNNPHKASLYLACGIPLVVWSKSAIAKFVQDNNVGICVNNLMELEEVIKDMDNRQYNKIVKNVEVIQQKIISGSFLDMAIKKSERLLSIKD